jgi:iron complex transport system substrate-binding protein
VIAGTVPPGGVPQVLSATSGRRGLGRRDLLRGAGAVGLTLALTGCGAGGDDASVGSTPQQRVIAHKFGETRISGLPQRVVTVGLTEQDYVLALGVVPVGVREWFGGRPGALWPWASAELRGAAVPQVLPVDAVDFEQIAALGPDLVLGVNSGLTQADYELLAKIAPTVAQPAAYADYGVPWQVITETVGIALGRSDDAEALVPAIDGQFERARADNPQFAGRTALLAAQLADGTFYVYAEGPAPRFLTDLGFTLPPAAAALFTDKNRAPVMLSQERLGLLEADVLVLGLYGGDAVAVLRDPVFADLAVARQGRVIMLPQASLANGALTFGSVLSLAAALTELVPRLTDAVDGDPATAVSPPT